MLDIPLTANELTRVKIISQIAETDVWIIRLNKCIIDLKIDFHFHPWFFPKDPVAYKKNLRGMQDLVRQLEIKQGILKHLLYLQIEKEQREMQQSAPSSTNSINNNNNH